MAYSPVTELALLEEKMPDGTPGGHVSAEHREAASIRSKADLASEVRLLIQAAERESGRRISRERLAGDLGVSVRSLYAYMSGETLMQDEVLAHLLRLLGAPEADQRRLRRARDRLFGERRTETIPVVRGLPAKVSAFTGRAEQLAELNRLRAARRKASAVVISAVSGTAGVGKTALAVYWAHGVRARFPDGCLYLDLRGYDPGKPLDPARALGVLLRTLGVADADIPLDQAERLALYRTLLDKRRILILLDNAFSAEQVRPLLPGASSCFVVVTSRDDLAGLVARDGAVRLDLDVLSPEESLVLLGRLLGEDRIGREREAAGRLAALCARLPLALRVAAEVGISRKDAPVSELAAELERRRLDMLEAGGDEHTAVRSVFSWSYRHLDDDGALAFRMLGLNPGRDFDVYAVAALVGGSLQAAGRQVEVLARAHLIQGRAVSRFEMHDLLRAYASDEVVRDLEEDHRRAALSRLLEYYVHASAAAMDVVYPYEKSRRPEIAVPATAVPAFAEAAEARAWLDAELPNLIAITGYAVKHGWPAHASNMATIISRYLETTFRLGDALTVDEFALLAVRALGDRAREGRALSRLGSDYLMLGRMAEALEHYLQGLPLIAEAGDRAAEARALGGLGTIYETMGRYEDALDYLTRAHGMAQEAGDRTAESGLLGNLGNVYWFLGRRHEALERFEQALTIAQQIDDRASQGRLQDNIGSIYSNLGRYEEASDRHQSALTIARETGFREGECFALINLAAVQMRRELYPDALEYSRQALVIALETSHRKGQGYAMASMAETLARLGRYSEALDHDQQALDIAVETDDRTLETTLLNSMAGILHASGRPDDARERYDAALSLARAQGNTFEHANALAGIGMIMHTSRRSDDASRHWQEALAMYTGLDAPEADEIRERIAALDD